MRRKYIIKNGTEYPQREVRKLITFAGRELDLPKVMYVDVTHTRGGFPGSFSGLCIGTNHVILRISRNDPEGWQMALLEVAGHELRHSSDKRNGVPMWGNMTGKQDRLGRRIRERAIGREREEKARAYGRYVVQEWTKREEKADKLPS